MNKHQFPVLVSLALIVVLAPTLLLATNSSDDKSPWKLPVTFSGTLPCADCPGIEVTLTLRADGSYFEHFKYMDRNSQFAESGRWSVEKEGTRLVLRGEKDAVEQWAVVGADELRKLDAEGKEIDSKQNFTLKRVASGAPKLRGKEWQLREMNGHAVDAKELKGPITIEFDEEEDRFSSASGCNRLNGSFKLSGSELNIKPGPMTMMACPEPAMSLEQEFVKMLGTVDGYRIEGAGLTLSSKGKSLAKFATAE